MTDAKQLEDEVRQGLRAAAGDALVVEDREFDPRHTDLIDLPEVDPERSRRMPRGSLVAAIVVGALLVSTVVVVRRTGASNDSVHVGAATTTTTKGAISVAPEPPAEALLATVASVPAGVLAAVGKGSVRQLPAGLPGPVLAKDHKPRVIWIGSEYCPFCAAERWPLVQALSRFGTFSGLKTTSSAVTTPNGAPEVFPGTQGFSFAGATYESDYLEFESVETETNTYEPLETPTPEQQQLLETYNAPPYVQSAGAIPFVDFANSYLISGASYDTAVLQGRSRAEIVSALSDPNSAIAEGIDGAANVLTATLCRLTLGRPEAVCGNATIAAIQDELTHLPRAAGR